MLPESSVTRTERNGGAELSLENDCQFRIYLKAALWVVLGGGSGGGAFSIALFPPSAL
jgi:hypothetical protein